MKKILPGALKHKFASGVIVIILVGIGYWGYSALKGNTTQIRYILGSVQKGTVITSVSGTGQISASNQIDIKSKVSGAVLAVPVQNSQNVRAGALLVSLDSRDAQKTARDAQTNLESAQLALTKLKQAADAYTVLQAENAVAAASDNLEKLKLSQPINYQKAKDAQQKAQDDISKAYDDTFNEIANDFLDLPTIMTDLNNTLYASDISANESSVGKGQWNTSVLINTANVTDRDKLQVFQTNAVNDYTSARSKYDATFTHYKSVDRYADRATIDALLTETLETTKSVAQAAKSESNYLDAWSDSRSQNNQSIFPTVKAYQTTLSTDTGKVNGHLSTLLTIQRTLQDDREAITAAQNDLKTMDQNNPLDLLAAEADLNEKKSSLETLKAGAKPIDIQSQELSVKQRENALFDARETLADYSIRALFDGVITKITIRQGDPVSANTAIATLITKQRTALISLNEIDAAKINVGQKATLSFDAVDGLNITGQVAEIDSIGAVTQGVVTYNVKLVFDTQDDRIKPGMSVSAAIITDVKQDALNVPNSAVKSQGNNHYVEMLDQQLPQTQGNQNQSQGVTSLTPPRQQAVEIGISNDTSTEITSGLKEGDQIIVRTVNPSTTSSATPQAPSLFGSPGGNRGVGGGGGGGGAGRIVPRGD